MFFLIIEEILSWRHGVVSAHVWVMQSAVRAVRDLPYTAWFAGLLPDCLADDVSVLEVSWPLGSLKIDAELWRLWLVLQSW